MQINDKNFIPDSYETFLQSFEQDLQKEYGENFKIVPGGVIETIAQMVFANYDNLQTALNYLATQYDPDRAEGDWQDSLYERIGVVRYPASKTIFSATISGKPNLHIKAQSLLIRCKRLNIDFSNKTEVVIDETGEVSTDFQSNEIVEITADDEFDIITAPDGINQVVASKDFVCSPGKARETDEEYRKRYQYSKAINSCGSKFSTYSSLLQYVNSPNQLLIIDKKDDWTIAYGLVRIIAHPNTTDETFAQAIFNSIACGTALSGDTEVTIYDGRKSPVVIRFQKAEEVGIKLKAVLKIKQEEDIESIKTKANAQIASYLAERPMGLGETVYASQFIIPLMQTAGIEAVLQIKIATDGDYAEYIEIGQEQIATLTDVVLTENV